GETLAIEIKGWRPGRPDPLAQGLAQIDRYLAGLGLDEGWLVIFDRRPGLPPVEERLATSRETSGGGRKIVVIRACAPARVSPALPSCWAQLLRRTAFHTRARRATRSSETISRRASKWDARAGASPSASRSRLNAWGRAAGRASTLSTISAF